MKNFLSRDISELPRMSTLFSLRSKAFSFSIIAISSSATRKAKQISTKLSLVRHKAKWSVNTSRNTSLLQYRYFKEFSLLLFWDSV